MIRIAVAALSVAVVLSAGRPTRAQTPPTPSPVFPSIGVMGYAPALRPGGTSLTNREEPGLLRRALPDGDIRDWIAEDDPSVGLLRRDGAVTSRVALLFDIGPDGQVTGCRTEIGTDDAYAVGLCERMGRRMRLTPALDLAGNRVADAYFIYVWFESQSRRAPTRLVDHMQLPPSPPPPLPPGGWPLDWASTSSEITGLDLLPDGGAAPAAGLPWAGVRITTDEGGRPDCSIVGSSGDSRFDRRACDAARRGRYVFPGATQTYDRRTWVHFVQYAGRPHAVLAEHERPARARIIAESLTAIRAAAPDGSGSGLDAVRLRLEIDASGRATQCLVTKTSGIDQTDIAACRLTLTLGRFNPAEDVFGRPRASSLYDWSPEAAPES